MLQTLACILLSLVAFTQAQTAVGLSSNATAACKSSCDWTDPQVWEGGVVPTDDSFAVTLQNTDVLNLVVSTPITINLFFVSDTNKMAANIQIVDGGSLTVTTTTKIAWTTTVTVQSGANFTTLGLVDNQGIVKVLGNFSANKMILDTANTQTADVTKNVYATVTLAGGYVIVPGGITIGSTSNLIGSGYVVGSVSSSGTISMGTASAVGTMYIYGDLDTSLSGIKDSQIYVKVASAASFDHLILSGTFTQNGNLYISPLNNYEPLQKQRFIWANHSGQIGGFDTTRGTGFTGIFNNQWKVLVDQSYTAVQYGSASNVAISFVVLAACALLSSL